MGIRTFISAVGKVARDEGGSHVYHTLNFRGFAGALASWSSYRRGLKVSYASLPTTFLPLGLGLASMNEPKDPL
jgi:hypothetical protein